MAKNISKSKKPDIAVDATGGESPEARKTEAVSNRLIDLEQAMGAISSAMDLFESLLGLCQRMVVKSQRAASVAERFATWTPLTLLHSAATMPQRDLIEEMERMSSELARMGAEYRLLKSEQRDAAAFEAEKKEDANGDQDAHS